LDQQHGPGQPGLVSFRGCTGGYAARRPAHPGTTHQRPAFPNLQPRTPRGRTPSRVRIGWKRCSRNGPSCLPFKSACDFSSRCSCIRCSRAPCPAPARHDAREPDVRTAIVALHGFG